MKTQLKKEKEITLFVNNVLTNDPCCLCGCRTDPGGFDYGIERRLVCDQCAAKYAPKLIDIRRAALGYAGMVVEVTKQEIRDKIKHKLNEPIEERIMSIFQEEVLI